MMFSLISSYNRSGNNAFSDCFQFTRGQCRRVLSGVGVIITVPEIKDIKNKFFIKSGCFLRFSDIINIDRTPRTSPQQCIMCPMGGHYIINHKASQKSVAFFCFFGIIILVLLLHRRAVAHDKRAKMGLFVRADSN